MYRFIDLYIYIHTYVEAHEEQRVPRGQARRGEDCGGRGQPSDFFTLSTLRLSRSWVRKDGNLRMEIRCKP